MTETYGNRRGKLTVTICDPDPGYAQADIDLASIGTGMVSQVVRADASEGYLHQLRLRIAENPTLVDSVDVFWTDASGTQHRIGLTAEDEMRWPAGFVRRAWDTEVRIREARKLAAATPEGP